MLNITVSSFASEENMKTDEKNMKDDPNIPLDIMDEGDLVSFTGESYVSAYDFVLKISFRCTLLNAVLFPTKNKGNSICFGKL